MRCRSTKPAIGEQANSEINCNPAATCAESSRRPDCKFVRFNPVNDGKNSSVGPVGLVRWRGAIGGIT